MKYLARLLIIFTLLMFVRGPARAQEKVPPASKHVDGKAIDAFMAKQVQEKALVGVSLALVQDGKLAHVRGYGKSDLAGGRAVLPDTLFAIGSITKQFTCTCILLLAEEGKLSIHDKVAKYYPRLTRAGDIELYDLMTHLAGYPDYYPLDFVDRRMFKPIAADQLLQEYATLKLDFEPRTRWSYSNTGFIILGRVVEKVSGEPFGAFLERRLLKPLGMEHTVFEPTPHRPDLATGYTAYALGPMELAHLEQPRWLFSAGGIYSTATDLAKWDLALMDGKVLKPVSYGLLTTSARLANGTLADYGCGLSVHEVQGQTVLTHGGAVGGYVAHNALIPGTRSALVVLTNSEEFLSTPPMYHWLMQPLLKVETGSAEKQKSASAAHARDVVPTITGPKAVDAAREFVRQLTSGTIDRTQLGEEFSYYLTDAKVRGAFQRLQKLGDPTEVALESTSERGGMEVAVVRFRFRAGILKALMYRSPDSKIQELLLLRS
jgi:CubicO group peptidase (beta-lactamase class C family)